MADVLDSEPKSRMYRLLPAFVFCVLCFVFTPVCFALGWQTIIAPLPVLVWTFFIGSAKSWTLWKVGYLLFYGGLFFGLGLLASKAIWKRTSGRLCALLFSILLLIPVATSFLPIVTYHSLKGGGGTYTFWTALARYFDVYSGGRASTKPKAEQHAP
jgi:hypothetical protein